MLLSILEWAILGVLMLLFVTQIFLPLWRGTPIFPLFSRERKLEAEKDRVKQEVVEDDLEREIKTLRRGRISRGEPPGKVSKFPGVKKDDK